MRFLIFSSTQLLYPARLLRKDLCKDVSASNDVDVVSSMLRTMAVGFGWEENFNALGADVSASMLVIKQQQNNFNIP